MEYEPKNGIQHKQCTSKVYPKSLSLENFHISIEGKRKHFR